MSDDFVEEYYDHHDNEPEQFYEPKEGTWEQVAEALNEDQSKAN
jgi:hypothetical protein